MTESIAYEAKAKADQAMMLVHSYKDLCDERKDDMETLGAEIRASLKSMATEITAINLKVVAAHSRTVGERWMLGIVAGLSAFVAGLAVQVVNMVLK